MQIRNWKEEARKRGYKRKKKSVNTDKEIRRSRETESDEGEKEDEEEKNEVEKEDKDEERGRRSVRSKELVEIKKAIAAGWRFQQCSGWAQIEQVQKLKQSERATSPSNL